MLRSDIGPMTSEPLVGPTPQHRVPLGRGAASRGRSKMTMRKWLTGRALRRVRHLPQIRPHWESVVAHRTPRWGIVVRGNDGIPRERRRPHHLHAPNDRNLTPRPASVKTTHIRRRLHRCYYPNCGDERVGAHVACSGAPGTAVLHCAGRRASRVRHERARPGGGQGRTLDDSSRARLVVAGLAPLGGVPKRGTHPRPVRRAWLWPCLPASTTRTGPILRGTHRACVI